MSLALVSYLHKITLWEGDNMHILIIEDEEQLCRSVAEGLRIDGYGNRYLFRWRRRALPVYDRKL